MKYAAPEMEMVIVETEDVILTSTTATTKNGGDMGELPEEEI